MDDKTEWSRDVFRCQDSVPVIQSLEEDSVTNVEKIISGTRTCSASVSEKHFL